MVRKYFKLIVLLLLVGQLYAQQRPIYLHVNWPVSKEGAFVQKNVSYQSFCADSAFLNAELSKILLGCYKLSFVQAQFTSFQSIGDSIIATLALGNAYKWIGIRAGNASEDILSGAGFRNAQFNNKPFNPDQFSKRVERLLQYLENNGYPFAEVRLDSVQADSMFVSASLNLTLNNLIVFDTLDIIGDAKIKKWYLYKYLGLKPGSNYNESSIKQANSRLSQLPFLKTTGGARVYFFGNKAMPILSLDNRKSSSIDGVVGFAPNTVQNPGASEKLLITGEANLKLQNLFGSGKSFELNYRSFLGNSQDLKIKFMYPYIFRSNIAFDYELNLLKQDTTYLDIRNEIGFQYRFVGNDYFKVYYSIQNTSLITIDTNAIKATRKLPAASDITNNTYGAAFRIQRFDYFFNPRKGYTVDMNMGFGVKVINRNPTIEALRILDVSGETYGIYDSIQLSYFQTRFQGMAEYYIPLFQRATVRLQAMGGHIASENLFVNELFRIGGIRTLKGFDEQSIFASSYAIGNLELRYLLQENSNVLLFWNGAYYRNMVYNPVVTDKPFGFGAGFNFETNTGVFSIFYAVGKEKNNPVNFNRAKVHFGFVNYF